MHGTRQQDRAAALLRIHVAQARPRRQERTVEVYRQHALPVRERDIDDLVEMLYPGIAHQNVDAAETGSRRVHAALHFTFVGHIQTHGDRARDRQDPQRAAARLRG